MASIGGRQQCRHNIGSKKQRRQRRRQASPAWQNSVTASANGVSEISAKSGIWRKHERGVMAK
jgi:hypothetical protein